LVDELNPEELGAYFALVTAGDLVQRAVTSQLRENGLTPVQFSILARLLTTEGGARMSELADALVVSRGGLTYQITQLEKQGLVERVGSGVDDRGVLAQITDAGRSRVTAAFPGHVALVRENFLDVLDAAQLENLRASLEQVVAKLGGVTG
jgi:DNA-binding MarR family transcriptional regulator